jgi:hypothetical protein
LKSILGKIDSFNISCEDFEYLLVDKNKYSIEVVKSIDTFKPKRWSETFGKSLKRNIVEAKILHTHTGLTLALKRYAVNPNMQTLEIAGLHGYNEKSELLQQFLNEIWEQIQECYIRRIDIAIDTKKIPQRIIKELKKNRVPFTYKNTEYFKSLKEKKENPRLNFKIYNKTKKENLDFKLERFEIVFKGSYFTKVKVKDLKSQFSKMEKTILRFSGQKTKILLPIS